MFANVDASVQTAPVVNTETDRPWWRRLIDFFRKWNPLRWFWQWLQKFNIVSRFVEWVKRTIRPQLWDLTKDAVTKGTWAAVGGIGSNLVHRFMESKDGKWDRALSGVALPAQGMQFQPGQPVPAGAGYGATSVVRNGSATEFPFR